MQSRGTTLLKWILISAVAFAVSPSARADEESDRNSLIRDIEDRLNYIKGYVDGIRDDSSTGDLDYARDKANEITSKVNDLKNVKGSDSKANMMVDKYPGYVDEFKEALRSLKLMKEEDLQQKNKELWKRCKEAEDKLKDEIRKYTDKNDPDGVWKIPEYAESLARPYDDELDKHDDIYREIPSWKNTASRFGRSDGWSDIAGEMREGADGIWDVLKSRHEEIHKQCDNLAMGKKNPLVTAAVTQLTDGEKIRAELYIKLDETLGYMADNLSDLPGRSDTSSVQNALEYAEKLKSLLDALKNARGEDRKAKEISDKWPDQVSKFITAATELKNLKASQFVLDKGPSVCEDAERKLQDLIRESIANADEKPEGENDIREMSKALGQKYSEKLEAAQKKYEEMDKYRDNALRFDYSEGKWGPVKERMQSGANNVLRYFSDKLAEVKKECGNLALGEKHPGVIKALDEFGKSGSTTDREVEDIRKDYEDWKKEVREFRKLYRVDVDKIRLAICDSDDMQLEDRVKNEAERAKSELGTMFGALAGRADRMVEALDKLGKKKKADKERTRLRKNIKASIKSLDNTQQGLLMGIHNPKIRSRLEYGKKMHDEMQGSMCPNSKEVILDHGRIDCVIVSSGECDIVEIKPNNSEAKAKGEEQLKKYRGDLNNLTEPDFKDSRAVFHQCKTASGKVNVGEYRVETYEFCPKAEEIADELPDASED